MATSAFPASHKTTHKKIIASTLQAEINRLENEKKDLRSKLQQEKLAKQDISEEEAKRLGHNVVAVVNSDCAAHLLNRDNIDYAAVLDQAVGVRTEKDLDTLVKQTYANSYKKLLFLYALFSFEIICTKCVMKESPNFKNLLATYENLESVVFGLGKKILQYKEEKKEQLEKNDIPKEALIATLLFCVNAKVMSKLSARGVQPTSLKISQLENLINEGLEDFAILSPRFLNILQRGGYQQSLEEGRKTRLETATSRFWNIIERTKPLRDTVSAYNATKTVILLFSNLLS